MAPPLPLLLVHEVKLMVERLKEVSDGIDNSNTLPLPEFLWMSVNVVEVIGCDEVIELNVMREELVSVILVKEVFVSTSIPSLWLRWMREEERTEESME